jgi:hypothetical protein
MHLLCAGKRGDVRLPRASQPSSFCAAFRRPAYTRPLMALRRQSYLRGKLLKGHNADLSFCGSSELKFALNPIYDNSSCIFTIIMIYSAQILRFIKYLTMQDGCLVVMVKNNQGIPKRKSSRLGFQFICLSFTN